MSNMDQFYAQAFAALDVNRRGRLGGGEVFQLFQTSGLPKNKLSAVWEGSAGQAGNLDRNRFILACKLIALAQNTTLPLNAQSLQGKNLPCAKLNWQRLQQQQQPQMGGRGVPPMGRGAPPQQRMPGQGAPPMHGQGPPMGMQAQGMMGRGPQMGRGPPGPAHAMGMPGRGMGMPPQQMGVAPNRTQAQPPQMGQQAEEPKEPEKADAFAGLLGDMGLPQKKTPELAAMPVKATPSPQMNPIMPGMMNSQAMGMNSQALGGQAMAGMMNNSPQKSMAMNQGPDTSSMMNAPDSGNFGETSKLRARLRAAEEMERRAKSQATELREKVDDMERKMAAMEEKMAATGKQNQAFMSETQNAQRQVAPLLAENAQLREGIAQWTQRSNQQQAEIEGLNEQIQILREKVESMSDVERAQSSFQARLSQAETRAMNAEEQMGAIERELFQVKRERDALQADVDFYKNKGLSAPAQSQSTAPEQSAESQGAQSSDYFAGISVDPISQSADSQNVAPAQTEAEKKDPSYMTQEQINSFQKGDLVLRKGKEYTLIKIDNTLDPPGCTVRENATGNEVGTELWLLTKPDPHTVSETAVQMGEPPVSAADAMASLMGDLDATFQSQSDSQSQQSFQPDFGFDNSQLGAQTSPPQQFGAQTSPPQQFGAQTSPPQQFGAQTSPPQQQMSQAKEPSKAPVQIQPPTQIQPDAGSQYEKLLPFSQTSYTTYDEYFQQADSNKDGQIDGPEAFTFFSKSSVPRQILANIWRIVDVDGSGKLSKLQFFSMFHIVLIVKQNPSISLPKTLPTFLSEDSIAQFGPQQQQQQGSKDDDWDDFDF